MIGSLVRGLVLLVVMLASVCPAVAQDRGQESGTVSGTVLDKSTGDPIIEAGVEIVGHGKKTVTDLDGNWSVTLPPGSYEIRVFAPLYEGLRLQNVAVKAGQVTKANASLASAGQAGVEVVEVVAQANKAAEATQLLQRKTSSVVSETISAEVVKKSPGSDAADIVQRSPAVTVSEDDFVTVRGLDERYTSALLNGTRLPSTNPLKRVVPLDLFPADFLESLQIIKTFSPDLPGDFSGGLVVLNLKDYPEQLTYSMGVSVGGNTQTTTREYLTYEGSDLDYIGLGEGFRNPPSNLPDSTAGFDRLPESRKLAVARSFKDIWQLETEDAPPNFGANFSVGNTWGPFGFQLGGVYTTEYETRRNEIKRQFDPPGLGQAADTLSIRDDYRSDTSVFTTRLGGVLTGAYKITDRDKITLRSFVNRNSRDEGKFDVGTNATIGTENLARQSRLKYVEEELAYGQLAGEHRWDWLQIDWRSALSRTTQDEPDTRHTTYVGPVPDGPFVFVEDSLGGLRISNETRERLTDSHLDFTIPFKTPGLPGTDVWDGLPGKLKFGPAYSFRDRDFQQRRFRFTIDQTFLDPTLPADELLDPDNIGPGRGVSFSETTSPSDHFQARQEVIAGYGMLELPIVRDMLRVVGGARYEYSLIRLDTDTPTGQPPFDCPGGAAVCAKRFRLLDENVLPAVNAILSPRDDMNVRFSWSQSVARPEFRELAPTEFPAQRGERATFGNAELVQTDITSYDLRWEWFFSPLELVSLGGFYKDLTNPIEQVTTLRGSDLADTWVNAGEGSVYGFEFEARKELGFIHRFLDDVSFQTNVTWSESEVNIPRTRLNGILLQFTNESRPLQGQAPFIVNAALEYSNPEIMTARLLYMTQDRTIDTVGASGLDDFFLERRDQLDAIVLVPLARWTDLPLTAKFAAENILNAPYVFTTGGFVQRKYTSGVKLSLGISYTY